MFATTWLTFQSDDDRGVDYESASTPVMSFTKESSDREMQLSAGRTNPSTEYRSRRKSPERGLGIFGHDYQ
jgi:hypothetical protein